MTETIIGIDPGSTGAIAVFRPTTQSMYVFSLTDKTPREIVDVLALESLKEGRVRAFFEKVHSMPGQGVASMFTFGKNTGIVLGIVATLGIRYEEVTPQAWQRGVGMGTKQPSRAARKTAAHALAQQLYPQTKILKSAADAVLIAEYGRRVVEGRAR